MYAKVLTQYKVKSLDKVWTYKIPENLKVLVGSKVKIPFGKVILNGIVLEITNECEIEEV